MGLSLIAMFVFQLVGVRIFPQVLRVPLTVLVPIVLVLSFVGTFAVDGQAVVAATYNMGVAFGLGVIGYLLKKTDYPISPMVLGIILGGMLEENFRLAVKLAQGNYLVFFERPIVLFFVALIAVSIAGPALMKRREKARSK